MIFVEVILTIGFCFAIISILFSLVTIFLQLWVPRLRRFPGIIITMQCISQIFYDLHWLPVLPSINETMKDNYSSICEIWGFFTMLFYFLGYNYATCLSFEIIFKLKNRVNFHYRTRMWVYHISAWLLASIFCIILLVYKAYGISGLKTCSVSNSHPLHSLEYAPFVLNLPIMWFSVIYAIKKLKWKYFSTTMNYALVIISVSLTWFFPTFLKLIMVLTKTEENLALAAFLIGTLSGTCVGLSRVTNKKVQKEIKKHYKYLNIELKNLDLRKGKVESQEGFSNLLDISNSLFESEEIDFFTNFYEAISKQVLII